MKSPNSDYPTQLVQWEDVKDEPGFRLLADAAMACVRGVTAVDWDMVGLVLIHESPATMRDFSSSPSIPLTHFPNGVSMATPPLEGLREMFGGFEDGRAHCVLTHRDKAVLVGIRDDEQAETLGRKIMSAR